MDHESELTSDPLLAIEACRPDSDDGNLPEVAAALAGESTERVLTCRRTIERFDRAMTGAVQQVAVPVGLAERILAGLVADTASQDLLARPAEAATTVDLAGAAAAAAPSRPGWRFSRRYAIASTFLALAASILVVFGVRASRETLDPAAIQTLAEEFFNSDNHQATLSNVSSPITLPVAASAINGERTVTFLGRTGKAYELSSGRRGVKGTLYVVSAASFWGPALDNLPKTPVVAQGTMGLTVAAWTSGSNVFVMVVKGDPRAFMSFFSQKLA